jgi:hypothetical protein
MKKKFLTSALGVLVLLAMTKSTVMPTPPRTWGTDVTMFNTDSANNAHPIFTKYKSFDTGVVDTGTQIAMPGMPLDAAASNAPYIAPGGSYYYNPVSDPNFGTNFNGSVVLSSDRPLAAIVGVGNNFKSAAYAGDTYGGISKTSAKVILPIVMGRLGTWNTRISIQNAGSAATNVTLTYVGTANVPAPTTISNVPANQAVRIDQYDAGVTGFNGSAIVTTNNGQPVAVTVEEYRTSGGVLITYNGIVDTDADSTVYMPGYIDRGAWATDMTIVNVDTAVTANVTISFTNSTSTIAGPIAAGKSVYFNRTQGLPAGFSGAFPNDYYGSATVTTTGGKVVTSYNITNNRINGLPANNNMGYVGFPSSAAATTVIDPLVEDLYHGWESTFTVQNVEGGTANLKLYYAGNTGSPAPLCNPCLASITTGSMTFVQQGGGHVSPNFIGGVRIVSDKKIVVIGDQGQYQDYSANGYSAGDTAGGFTGFGQ